MDRAVVVKLIVDCDDKNNNLRYIILTFILYVI